MMDMLRRYTVATMGLMLVALGVALSLQSNLGTSPVSCPPAMLHLKWGSISFGIFTWIVNFSFIFLQLALLRSRFRLADLMQIPAVLLFGLLCDVGLWLCESLPSETYVLRMLWCVLAIVITAIGLRIEIEGRAWMLSGDKAMSVVSDVLRVPFSTVKVWGDVLLVAVSVAFAWVQSGDFFGDGVQNVVREGTLLLALFTGLCMKVFDPFLIPLLTKYSDNK